MFWPINDEKPKENLLYFSYKPTFSCIAYTHAPHAHMHTQRCYLCPSCTLNPFLMTSKCPLFSYSFSLPLNVWEAWQHFSMQCGQSYAEIAMPPPGARLLVSTPWLKQHCELLFVLFKHSRKQANLNHRWRTTACTPKGCGRKTLAVDSEARLYPGIIEFFLALVKRRGTHTSHQNCSWKPTTFELSFVPRCILLWTHHQRKSPCSRAWTQSTIETMLCVLRCVCLKQRSCNIQKKQ